MSQFAMAVPILPGKTQELKRWAQESQGPRRKEYTASRRRLGILFEKVFIQPTPQGDLLLLFFEDVDHARMNQVLASSQDPYDVWFRQKMQEITGIDFSQPATGAAPEMLLNWQSERQAAS
ncbi:MAG: DUF6176 family protein [Anaerolineales bacterium]|jgi:hypothetical protein